MKLDREKFWRGLFPGLRLSEGKVHWVSTVCRVADMYTRCWIDQDDQIVFCGESLPDPANANEVRLEVLLDGLERLDCEAYVCPVKINAAGVTEYFAYCSGGDGLCHNKDFRLALIAAICKLLGMEVK